MEPTREVESFSCECQHKSPKHVYAPCSTYRDAYGDSPKTILAALSELVLLAFVVQLELLGVRVGDRLELLKLELHQRVVALQ